MPLKAGQSDETVSSNISTLMGEYQKSGKIGTAKPADKGQARRQAVAISLSKREESKYGGKIKAERFKKY